MRYSTIQVTPAMRRRLARYKTPGMSYEAVLDVLTTAITPEEFRAHVRRAETAAGASLRQSRTRSREDAAEEARRWEAERILRMTPGERMEEAFRLFELVREIP